MVVKIEITDPVVLAAYKMPTPWGTVDYVTHYGDGIVFVSTPSHGGFFLPPEMNAQVPATWRAASFCGQGARGWYEEDCDATMVVLTFPDRFTAGQVADAERMRSYVENKAAKLVEG